MTSCFLLGLDRTGWILSQPLDEEQLCNGETDNSPSTDGPQNAEESPKEASTDCGATNAIQPLSKDKIEELCALHAGHRDDLALLHHLAPDLAGEQRPRSLAVPWMTTASSLQQQPPSPVMSMSPQAAYLSKIIPNAVLPPSIDVVEISRGRSRNSVRTVSKSSLLLSSPAPSRASSRASSIKTTSSNITSASQYNASNLSDSSCWSNSDSSETLVSDSSTISSSSTARPRKFKDGEASAKGDKGSVISSNHTSNGKLLKGDKACKDGQFVRSLSVMKSKRAPPPPRRSYSLHNKMKHRSRDLADVRDVSGEASLRSNSAQGEESEKKQLKSSQLPSKSVDSPGYHADTSSLDDSMSSESFTFIKSQLQETKTEDAQKDVSHKASPEKLDLLPDNKLNKNIISPSSGYSSQDATSPQVSAHLHSSSKHKKGILAKLQRLFPGSTSAGSASFPKTQPTVPEMKNSVENPKPDTAETVSVSPSVWTLRDLFNIPAPPKVHAPPPPPPEVWAHNKRTFELLLGPPAPDNTYAIIKKNPKDRRQQRHTPSVSSEGSVKGLVVERKHKNPTVTAEPLNGTPHVLEEKTFHKNGILNGETRKENKERLVENGDLKESGKDEKVRVCDMLNGMLIRVVEKREERLTATEERGQNTSVQPTEVKTNMDTLPDISLVQISPSTNPSLVQQSPRPLTPQTTEAASVTSVQVVSPELSWPPPPPPLVQVGISGLEEIDYPLPPPPSFAEERLEKMPPTASVKPEVKAENVNLSAGAEPQKLGSSKEVAPPPLSIPPPPPYSAPPPPATPVPPCMQTEDSSPSPLPVEPEVPTIQDVISLVSVTPPSPAKEASPPPVVEVSSGPPKEVAAMPTVEFTPASSQEKASQFAEKAPLESEVIPTESIPPSPSEQKIDPPQENTPQEPETNTDSSNSILMPPESIPPPPPIEPLLQPSVVPQTDNPADDEAPPSPPSEFKVSPLLKETEEHAPSPPLSIPLPPALPEECSDQSSPQSTTNQSLEEIHAPVVQEEPIPIITPSFLKMVKLRSVNNSPEPPEAQEQPEPEVTVNEQELSIQIPPSSAGSEVPQKPIRRSLIMTPPTSISPPVTDTAQTTTTPKSPVIPPVPSSTGACPIKKSPPATTIYPSMNLQEAIRLRTAARSKESASSRLSLHSPLSPPSKSPTSTASFIFSKSNKKIVIETIKVPEDKETIQKNLEGSSATNVISEAEVIKKGAKVPPPIAKKPKAKGKGFETCEGVEQTAGQEAQQESVKGNKVNMRLYSNIYH